MKGIKTYFLMHGTNKICCDYVVGRTKDTVQYGDGGWNHAEDVFFTEDQCRRFHRLPPVNYDKVLRNVASKLATLAETIENKADEIQCTKPK